MNISRVAIVTGAGSPTGIGFACAQRLVADGFAVVMASTTPRIHDRADEVAQSTVGGIAVGVAADLTALDGVATVRSAAERMGTVVALVNNAGMMSLAAGSDANVPIEQLSLAQWNDGLARNLTTAFLMSQAVVPSMRANHFGRIVNIASTTGAVVAMPEQTVYSAAKAGMVGMTRSLALEVARAGVTVNAIAPGWIDTASMTESERRAGCATPVGRPGMPSEIAACVAYLVSEAAGYTTGQLFTIDGANAIVEDAAIFKPLFA